MNEEKEKQRLVASIACPTCGLLVAETLDACPNDGTLVRGVSTDSTLLERYKLLEPIGEGGMSVIYKARHLLMDKMVAIKLLHARLGGSQTSVKRFQLEAKAASLLDHPNIIRVHDFGVLPNGTAFLVMDYEPGESLAAYIGEHGRLAPEESLPLFKALASALDHAHQQNVLHRDLKPSNIMLTRNAAGDLTGKIVDFGIAKVLNNQSEGDVAKPQLTATGEVFGSPSYMSPEQCQGGDLDSRSDIYSLGCLMYEALSGYPPFAGANALEILFKQINEDVAPLAMAGNPRLTQSLNNILKHCLAKERNARYGSARDIVSDLVTVELGGAIADSGRGRPARPSVLVRLMRQPRTQLMAVLLVIGVALLNVLALRPAQQPVHELHEPPATIPDVDRNLTAPTDGKPDMKVVAFPERKWPNNRKARKFDNVEAWQTFTPQRDFRSIDLSHTSITDDSLKLLAPYEHLSFLALDDTGISNAGLATLKDVPSLEYLSVMKNYNIDNDGLAPIGELRKLTHLHLNRSPNISDGALKHLANLKKLTTLGLSYTHISSAGMIYALKTHPNLEHFSCGAPSVDDAAVIGMPVMNSLRTMRLQGSAITDKSLPILASRCPRLTQVNVQGTNVTFEGLKSLLVLPQLTQLMVQNCPNVTTEQIALLKKAKPGLKVNETGAEGRSD